MADRYEPSNDRFLGEVAKHQINIIKNDGLHRHLRFKNPASSSYWFDLITWPGTLCIHGDCGSYVFSRIEDMFNFFRGEVINPQYWAEKCEAECKTGGVNEFCERTFRTVVVENFRQWFEDCMSSESGPGQYTWAERRACWEQIKDEVLYQEDEHGAYNAAYGFNFTFQNGRRFTAFDDFWEHNLEKYTHRFIWNLRAIVWGIAQFDAATAPAPVAEVVNG